MMRLLATWPCSGARLIRFERTRPFGVVAAALDLSRRSPDPRKAAIGALLVAREHWGIFDALGMMQQLGAIPAAAPA
jgi:hypothetical protein